MTVRHVDDLIPLSRRALAKAFAAGRQNGAPFAVDATMGNGHDTLFLTDAVGENGLVWAFDVQRNAHETTRRRFAAEAPNLLPRVHFCLAGHETANEVLPPDAQGRVWGVTFNLGFLPGSDKQVVTRTETTLAALQDIAAMTALGGVVSVHCYLGHAGGEDEGRAVEAWFAALPWDAWRVAQYSFVNKAWNKEILFLAERIA